MAFSPDGKTLAAGDTGGVTYLWPISGGTAPTSPSGQLTDPSGVGVQGLAFSPDGKILATGDANGSTYLWNVEFGRFRSDRDVG